MSVFYITGFQRSGTTLLAYLLDRHPDVLCADEPEFAKRIIYGQKEKLSDLNNDSIRKNLDFYGADKDKYLELVREFRSGTLSESDFLLKAYQLLNVKHAAVTGVKEVVDLASIKFDFLNRLVGIHPSDTKYIFIERNLNGIVSSFEKLGFFLLGRCKYLFLLYIESYFYHKVC